MSEERYHDGERVVRRWDRVFEALSAAPRRQVLASLVTGDEPVSLPESAAAPHGSVGCEALRVSLCHRHLPQLADAGFVDWESDPFRAYRGPRFDDVATVLRAMEPATATAPDPPAGGRRRQEPGDERE